MSIKSFIVFCFLFSNVINLVRFFIYLWYILYFLGDVKVIYNVFMFLFLNNSDLVKIDYFVALIYSV